MFALANVMTLLLAAFGNEEPVRAGVAIPEPGLYAFYHRNADVLNAGLPIFSSIHASGSERDSRIDDHFPASSRRSGVIVIGSDRRCL